MGGHALDVLHEADGILKDLVIDALVDVVHRRAPVSESGTIRVVDMAVAIGFGGDIIAGNLELMRYGAQIMRKLHSWGLAYREIGGRAK